MSNMAIEMMVRLAQHHASKREKSEALWRMTADERGGGVLARRAELGPALGVGARAARAPPAPRPPVALA
jgi:hypothetical protein